jgi:Putative metal-binding motif
MRASSLRASSPILAAGMAAAIVASCWPTAAWARKTGIAAAGCEGCHNGGQTPTVTLSVSPTTAGVNEPITITVSVSQTNGPVAGFYLTTADLNGTFDAFEAGTTLMTGGVTHTMPRTGANGFTLFHARWSSPVATGVELRAYAVSANGNNAPSGDAGGSGSLSMTVGCTGVTLYTDQDGDGYGTSDPAFPTRKECGPKAGYALVGGDCEDLTASVHPMAVEMCNGKDDNCNGQIDENVVYQPTCQDRDGDGHGVPGTTVKMDCAPSAGFGDCGGDCDDTNAAIHPGATEVCDGRDNNCDGTVDEGVRPACGVGWCRRYALGCTSVCTPGPPRAEACNSFDDDCDGVIDNGTDAELCGASGLTCSNGQCVPAGSVTHPDAGADARQGGDPGGGAPGDGDAPAGPAINGSHGGCALAPVTDVAVSVNLTFVWMSLVFLAAMRREKKRNSDFMKS